jgi:hypothetical protein
MPWKVAPVMLGPWQSAHPVVMPLWLNAEPANVGEPVKGIAVTLEFGPTWQLSQPNPRIGTWLLAAFTIGLVVPVL